MSARELILLSPHRFPTDTSPILGSDEIACFLNAWASLWHPALLLNAKAAPRIASPYDHEEPLAQSVYAVPESPTLVLPADWEQRLVNAGAVSYQASADRAATLARLRDLTANGSLASNLWELPPEKVANFIALGYGFALVNTLFEAMEHENVLAVDDFWNGIQRAAQGAASGDRPASDEGLRAAAESLRRARDVVYPVEIYWLDFCLMGDKPEERQLPRSLAAGLPLNVLMTGVVCMSMQADQPEAIAALRTGIEAEKVDLCGGLYCDQDDAELPLEAQLANLRLGQNAYRQILGKPANVFARKRFGMHPLTPTLLQAAGLQHAILLAFDDAVVPTYRGTVVNWPAPDGKQVTAFTRQPLSADEPSTFYHLAAHLRRTIADDHSATIALMHRRQPACPQYDDLLTLSALEPVLGSWCTVSRYLTDVLASEYASASTADDFRGDTLARRVDGHEPDPLSYFAKRARDQRRLDVARIIGGLARGLMGPGDNLRQNEALTRLESSLCESGTLNTAPEDLLHSSMQALAGKLLSKAATATPGRLLLNPCSYSRRMALELPHTGEPLPLGGPLKAAQFSDGLARLVVEVPGLGFVWLPRNGPPRTPAPTTRMKLADERCVRNEFFEAEIDPATGALRAFRDTRSRINRLGQQLVYNPGSTMRGRSVRATSTGPALGELVSEGDILGPEGAVLATFKQTLRAWVGRPLLELRIEIAPTEPPRGYAWHAYYATRFAWRDERSLLVRGVVAPGYTTTASHPETPDYLEVRSAKTNALILTGGLPFHQRQGTRMIDIVLLTEGESARSFEVGLALDRTVPMHTGQAMITPFPVLDVESGPPHIGSVGWLFHLDATNLLLTSLEASPDGEDAVIAHLLETHMESGQGELRCPRNPVRAQIVNLLGEQQQDVRIEGDSVGFDFGPGELIILRIAFS